METAKKEASKQARLRSLAAELLKEAESELLVSLRFLDSALFRLKRAESNDISPSGTDGIFYYYNPREILIACRNEREQCVRNYLHSVLHCLFGHPFRGGTVDILRYNLACDIAAENAINELGLENLTCKRSRRQDSLTIKLLEKLRCLTAERIYRYLLESSYSEKELTETAKDFAGDDHSLWYLPEEMLKEAENPAGDKPPGDGMRGQRKLNPSGQETEHWQDTGRSVRIDMATFSREWGSKAGTLTESIGEFLREKTDYREFLRRFSSLGESMSTSPDEFDYIFYTHGLNLYGNMPLIEPLEYREDKRIRDFVIAIDTSASVSGKKVRSFLQKTYNILCEESAFANNAVVHILQCDTEIRDIAVIRNRNDFERYIEHTELKGFGGTDFRPVFRYIDGLLDRHYFTDLKGLLYFTDGFGDYPLKKPEYETAFIFTGEEKSRHLVPPWAIKVLLNDNEVQLI